MPDHSKDEITPHNGTQWPTWASFGVFIVGVLFGIVLTVSFWIQDEAWEKQQLTPIECDVKKGCIRTMVQGIPCASWQGEFYSGDYVLLCAINGVWRHVEKVEKDHGI